jgi:hypothetical protein
MSRKARINFALDSIIAVAFLLSALSGVILYLFPSGYQGGRNPYYGREILFLDGHDRGRARPPGTALELDRVHDQEHVGHRQEARDTLRPE